jgi:transposase
VEATKQKEEKRKKPISPRNRKACHSVRTALNRILAKYVCPDQTKKVNISYYTKRQWKPTSKRRKNQGGKTPLKEIEIIFTRTMCKNTLHEKVVETTKQKGKIKEGKPLTCPSIRNKEV